MPLSHEMARISLQLQDTTEDLMVYDLLNNIVAMLSHLQK